MGQWGELPSNMRGLIFTAISHSPKGPTMPDNQSANDLLDIFEKARQTAKLRLHLLSLEARQRWQNVETHLDGMQSRLEREGDGAVASLGQKLQEVNEVIRSILNETRGSLRAHTSELMRTPKTCTPADNLSDAAQLMWDNDCGFVPVCEADGTLVGVVTDRDICMAAHLRGQLLSSIALGSVMTQSPSAVTPETPLSEVLRLMRTHQIKRLPVVQAGKLAGIITLADIARYLNVAEDTPEAAIALARTVTAICSPRSETTAQAAQ